MAGVAGVTAAEGGGASDALKSSRRAAARGPRPPVHVGHLPERRSKPPLERHPAAGGLKVGDDQRAVCEPTRGAAGLVVE